MVEDDEDEEEEDYEIDERNHDVYTAKGAGTTNIGTNNLNSAKSLRIGNKSNQL